MLFSSNQKLDVVCGGGVQRVMLSAANSDDASLGYSLFALLFASMILHMRLDPSTGELQAELALAPGCEEAIDIQSGQSIQQDQGRRVFRQLVTNVG